MRFKNVLLAVLAIGALFFEPLTILAKDTTNKKESSSRNRRTTISFTDSKSKSAYDILASDNNAAGKGLFNVFQRGTDYFFEVPLNLLGRDRLVVNKLQLVPEELNEAGVHNGINYNTQMIRFELDQENSR